MTAQSSERRLVTALALGLSLVVALCAVNSGSLWIDEFGTWNLTQAATFSEWLSRFQAWNDSDTQIPLYHFYMYFWVKLFGTDAAAMRGSNIPMFVLANACLLHSMSRWPRLAWPLLAAVCLSSPLWYYLNEIRPYIMIYLGVCVTVAATIEIFAHRELPSVRASALLAAGVIILCGTSILGLVWAGTAVLFIAVNWTFVERRSFLALVRAVWPSALFTAIIVCLLLAHYVRTIAMGKTPLLLHETNLSTIIYSFYGNSPLFGIGPGAADLRELGPAVLWTRTVPLMQAAAIIGAIGLVGCYQILRRQRLAGSFVLLAAIALPVLFTVAVGLALHWRVLPRHIFAIIVPLNIVIAIGLAWWWAKAPLGRVLAVAGVAVLLLSSLNVRFAERFAKENYEDAAHIAKRELAANGLVWWVADSRGGSYYDVPLRLDGVGKEANGAYFLYAAKYPALAAAPPPTLIVLSRPESYDPEGGVTAYIEQHHYRLAARLQSFTVWVPSNHTQHSSATAPAIGSASTMRP